jgi:hypothetical protein
MAHARTPYVLQAVHPATHPAPGHALLDADAEVRFDRLEHRSLCSCDLLAGFPATAHKLSAMRANVLCVLPRSQTHMQ